MCIIVYIKGTQVPNGKEMKSMRKIYRISAFNQNEKRREILYWVFTNKKKAQEFANKMNELGEVDARVVTQER